MNKPSEHPISYFPSRSPDGQRLVFQRTAGGSSRIGIVPVGGGEPRFLPWPARAYSPVWAPDGQGIAFVSNVDGTDDDIFVVSPGWVELARIRRAGRDRNPAWVRRTPAP